MMRLNMVRRKLQRSYSGGGYQSSDDDDDAILDDEYNKNDKQKRKKKTSPAAARRGRRRSLDSSTSAGRNNNINNHNKPLVLCFFVIVGTLFCSLDVMYFVRMLNFNHPNDEGDQTMQHETVVRPQTLPAEWDRNAGQEPLRKLVQEATSGQKIDQDIVDKLPKFSQIADLYGGMPYVYGLDTCQDFQQRPNPTEHFISVAGAFNTGTNLLAELLIANCYMPMRRQKYGTAGVRWQVLWGKHTPVFNETFRLTHRTYNDSSLQAENIFPAVTVRDPYKWMQSMCRHSYGADWRHSEQHCPNLVPNKVDYELAHNSRHKDPPGQTVNVTVKYAEFATKHASLAEFWNDWYKDYQNAPFPRLLVRFEDVVFHPKQVTTAVCECAGGKIWDKHPFKYIVDSAKKGKAHGKTKTSYVDALIKYGTEDGRYTGFTEDDLAYAKEHLDPQLMQLFGYPYSSTS